MQDLIFPQLENFSDGPFRDMIQYIIEGSKKLGKDFQSVKKYGTFMQETGFEDIHAVYFNWPIWRLAEEFSMLARSFQYELLDLSLLGLETMISDAKDEMEGGIHVDIQM